MTYTDTYTDVYGALCVLPGRPMTPHVRATLDAWILLNVRVPRDSSSPSEADCILLDAMLYLLTSAGL